MHKNRVWLLLLVAVAVVMLIFCGRAAADVYHYSRMSSKTLLSEISWEIRQRGRLFIPYAHYRFEIDGQVYSGEESLDRAWQRNQWSAEKEIEKLQSYRWSVWYDADRPDVSTLDRSFPWRSVVYAALLIGLCSYFIGLGFYVGGLQNYSQ